jgi:hypothetical protein
MASPHVAGVAALALAANTAASPWAVAAFLSDNATENQISSEGDGSPNLLVYSLAANGPVEPTVQTVAVWDIIKGSPDSYKNGWRASAIVTIGDPTTTWTAVAGATVVGSFSPGGTARCVTVSDGKCTLTSATIKNNMPLTKFTVTGVSGLLLNYDPTENKVTEITIDKIDK